MLQELTLAYNMDNSPASTIGNPLIFKLDKLNEACGTVCLSANSLLNDKLVQFETGCLKDEIPDMISSLSGKYAFQPTSSDDYSLDKQQKGLDGDKKSLLLADLGLDRDESWKLYLSLKPFEDDWNAPGMEAYDEL